MPNRSVSVMRRKGTNNHSYVRRIPVDLRERMVGLSLLVPVGNELVRCTVSERTTAFRFSLRTPDAGEAKRRMLEVEQFFEQLYASLRSSKPIALTHRQCVALAGAMYRNWADTERGRTVGIQFAENKPGAASWPIDEPFELPGAWQAVLDRFPEPDAVLDPLEELEPIFGPNVDHALRDRGVAEVDAPSRALILREFLRAIRDAMVVQRRQAQGDYTLAPEQNRFPEWQAPSPQPAAERKGRTEAGSKPAPALSLTGLFDRWWAEAKAAGRSQSTHDGYRATVHRFAAFLKHDDARAVTGADVVAYKDHRIADGASLKTVKDSDLVALRAIFAFAVGNGLLASNPAEGVKVMRQKRVLTRPKGFTDEEAKAILAKSQAHVPAANEKPAMTAAKRWVPWLCAYTGARVGEVVQLRKEDVAQVDGLWTITITPEAGTVKDKEVRRVVLHPHLVEKGFPQFAAGSKSPRLFLTVKPGEDIRGKWQATKNRLAEAAREVVPDERVQPNHGWRHLFKTRGREARVADSVLDAICGHAPGSVGGTYGDVSLQAQAKAFELMPRFEVPAATAAQHSTKSDAA